MFSPILSNIILAIIVKRIYGVNNSFKPLLFRHNKICDMVQFDENDLLFNDYENTITNKYFPDYIAIDDLETVNLKERFEVIFFCDLYLKKYKIDKDVDNFRKVEKIIRKYILCGPVDRKLLMKVVKDEWVLLEHSAGEPAESPTTEFQNFQNSSLQRL